MKGAICLLAVLGCLWAADGAAQDRAPSGQDETGSQVHAGAADAAQDADAATAPRLRIDFPQTETIPGQFLTLRLTVLVPSFMPAPPVWPGFEAPNLLVRVPEGATSPTSERIDGATWSGVTRRYLIAPMVPGDYSIPPQEVVVTWADPDAANPSRAALSTGPLAFSGVVPVGAEGLDPFIAATDLTLTQEITGNPGAMVPGDSLTRAVAIAVTGVSPMFLPALLGPDTVPGVAAYPDAPRLDETSDRGVVTGTRRESVTYVAENGGGGTLPSVTLDWFDIGTGAVVTATVGAVTIAVDGPPAAPADPWAGGPRAIHVVIVVALIALSGLALRRAVPPLRAWAAMRRAARRRSEAHAWRALVHAISRRDQSGLYTALDTWADRVRRPNPRDDARVRVALTAIGQERYGRPAAVPARQGDAWTKLAVALRAARRRGTVRDTGDALPQLNPGATV